MRRLVVDAVARIGEIAIVNTSFVDFGQAAATRYAGLIRLGYRDLCQSPTRNGSIFFEDDVYLYHLRHSSQGQPGANRVKRPRHVIVYMFDDDHVQVLSLLHDSMDIPARLRGDGSA